MIGRCLEHAQQERERGRKIVGIMCEYTPREIIMAAGGVPVCLCGGSAKTIPSAEEELPSNLCPLIKSTYGYHLEKSNPFLEMADLIVGETTCDGKKKMFELLGESRPVHVLELPQKENSREGLDRWADELGAFRDFLAERFGTPVTNEKIRDAIRVMNCERSLRRRLTEFMKADAPPLTGRQLLSLKSSISGIDADLEQYERVIEWLKNQPGVEGVERQVRVLMTGVPMVSGAERVLDIVEQSGGLVVAMESCVGLKPIMDDVDAEANDPVQALAEKYYGLPCSVMTKNDRRLDLLRDLAREYRADCVVDLVWQACLTYDVESQRVKRMVEEDLGLPYLKIETDYSPSDSARITVRVEALMEMTRARRAKGAVST